MAALRRTGMAGFGARQFNENNAENRPQKTAGLKSLAGKTSTIPTRRTALANIANQHVDNKPDAKAKRNAFVRPSLKSQNGKPIQREAIEKVKTTLPVELRVAEEEVRSFSSVQVDVVDIDEGDVGESAQLCAEYAKDVYEYLRVLEKRLIPSDYMNTQTEINEKMRSILVDWLIQVHSRFNLLQETLYTSIYLVDRYLSIANVGRGNLQLVGVSAMLLASKYEEMYAPEVSDFVYITDSAYSADDVRSMEKDIFSALCWDLSGPICLHFLRRFSKAGSVDAMKHTLAKYLMELILVDYKSCLFLPSMVAASALCLSIRLIDEAEWSPTLVHYSTYTTESLQPCMKRMAELLLKTDVTKLKAVPTKYASSKFMRISKLPELKGTIVESLAQS